MRDTPEKRNYQRSSSFEVRERVEKKILSPARTHGRLLFLEDLRESIMDTKAIFPTFFSLDRRHYRMFSKRQHNKFVL
jgi:hypothetical protein